MIKASIARKLQNLPGGLSDRIISLRLPIQDNKFATLFSVHAPTLQAKTGVKEAFYRDLHNLLQQVDSKDKLLILGDFNARSGRDFELWKGVRHRHGIGNSVTTGACFWSSVVSISSSSPTSCSSRRIGSRQHGDTHAPNTGHLLDYVLTRQHDTRDVLHTRVLPSADCYTDHRLVRCKVPLPSNLLPRGNVPKRRNCKCTNFVTQG